VQGLTRRDRIRRDAARPVLSSPKPRRTTGRESREYPETVQSLGSPVARPAGGAERVSDRMIWVDRTAPEINHTMTAARAKPQFSGPDEFSAPTGAAHIDERRCNPCRNPVVRDGLLGRLAHAECLALVSARNSGLPHISARTARGRRTRRVAHATRHTRPGLPGARRPSRGRVSVSGGLSASVDPDRARVRWRGVNEHDPSKPS
jgi:hypothetical protein